MSVTDPAGEHADGSHDDGEGGRGHGGSGPEGAVALRARQPDIRLAADLARLAGPDRRYAGCDDATVVVAAGRLTALISALEAARFAALREIVRRNPAAGHEAKPGSLGDLPGLWLDDTQIQVGLELARTPGSVNPMIELAVGLARLPLTEQALAGGTLDYSRARLIEQLTANLSDDLAAQAEAKLMADGWLDGKTWGQIARRLSKIVMNLDPDAATRRREAAERFARVLFGSEGDGTARLAGYNLPADEALQADKEISARALAYREHGLPGTIEQLRAQAFLDLLAGLDRRTGTPAVPADGSADGTPSGNDGTDEAGGDNDDGPGGDNGPGGNGDGGNGDGGNGDGGNGDGGGAGSGGRAGGGARGGLAANVDLTIPLATLLGIAERAGEADWLGTIDPALARSLALRAAASPASTFRIIVTDEHGHATGFGLTRRSPGNPGRRRPGRDTPPLPGQHTGTTPDGTPMADITPAAGSQLSLPGLGRIGPAYGRWRLRIGDLDLTADLHQISRDECGHELATTAYRPTALLRALVQIRDGSCSLPICARHPSGCEWEHGIPWPEGPTCACNGGLHCKRDHLLKQSEKWAIAQQPDGRRTWTTPAGLQYTSHLHDYPD